MASFLALLGEHDFVAFGIDAHGEVEWVFRGVGGFASEGAAGFFEERDGRAVVVALEAHAGPGAFAFSAAVDADDAAAEGELGDGVVAMDELGTEEVAVEFEGAIHVGGPDDVFDFFDSHFRSGFIL